MRFFFLPRSNPGKQGTPAVEGKAAGIRAFPARIADRAGILSANGIT